MPAIDYFAGGATATTIKAPAAVIADGAGGGVDINNYTGDILLVSAIYNTDGTNPTLATKFQSAGDSNLVDGTDFAGCPGTFTEIAGGPDTVEETITVTFSNATTAAVVGATTGAIGTATVGVKFTSPQISFLITAGTALAHALSATPSITIAAFVFSTV